MTDFFMMEKILENLSKATRRRAFFRKGVTVKGHFRPYLSLSEYTDAFIFKDIDIITPVTVRFSSLLGDNGTADTKINLKNMFVKFNSKEGEYDLICQNIPVSPINDSRKFLDLANAFKIKEDFDGINRSAFWEYFSENAENLIFAVMLYSYLGINKSFIDIIYYSVYLSEWINSTHEVSLVKYKWVPVLKENVNKSKQNEHINKIKAEFIAGYDPDIAVNEVERLIKNKNYPMYELHIQIADINEAYEDNLFESTSVWDNNRYPSIRAGLLILDDITSESDVYSIRFYLSNTVEGIRTNDCELNNFFDYILRAESIERGCVI